MHHKNGPMKLRVQFICLLGMSLIFTSCSKDSDNPNPDPDPAGETPKDTVYIAKIVNSEDSIAIAYNSNKTISLYRNGPLTVTESFNLRWYPQYENGMIKSAYHANGIADEPRPYYNFTNDQAGRVVRRYYVGANSGDQQSYDSFAYNDQGRLKATYSHDAQTGTTRLQRILFWENNNLVMEKEINYPYLPAQPTDTFFIKYKYSDKPNPFATIGLVTLWDPYVFYYLSANLVTERRFEEFDSQDYNVTTFEYEFNNKNYPVRMKATKVYSDGHTATWDDKITYLPEM